MGPGESQHGDHDLQEDGRLTSFRAAARFAPNSVGRLGLGLSLISTAVYFLSSDGVANFFRWLIRSVGQIAR